MITYQDLMLISPEDEAKRMAFVRSVIQTHKSSDIYKTAVLGYEYDHKRNSTIVHYEKTLRTLSGRTVPDTFSPNHKTTRNFFNYFTTQQNQYLLGNGVSWSNDEEIAEEVTEDGETIEEAENSENADDNATGAELKLGADFDNKLQKAGKIALTQGEAFGFFNLDHVDVFELREFAPLYDEENGALRAGVRFWQIDETKPLRATLYEEDGYTSYIWCERNEKGIIEEGGRVYEPKRKYIVKTRTTAFDGTEIYDGENYPTFPIVPLWGNPLHQSELVGIQEQIDAYDLIKNGYLNDLDTAQIYWVIKGAGGMDDPDLAQFMQRLKQTHFASVEDGQEVQPVEVNIPYAAREELLNRLERDLYKDYGALNIEEIRGGAVTATQIMAAYEPLNVKADQYEYCVIDFINGLCKVAGIEGAQPTFTRSKLVNVSEEIQTVIMASEVLDEEYTTEKVLNLLGDGDKFDEIQERKISDELEASGISSDLVIDEAENYTRQPLNGIQTESLLTIIGHYSDGTLSENQAINIISASIGISRNEARNIVLGVDESQEGAEQELDLTGLEDMTEEETPELEEETGAELDLEEEESGDNAEIDEIVKMLEKLLKELE